MALIAVAADKGSPGVTTTSVALAAVWPRPALLAECDPAGGDLVYRLPAADGGQLDPQRGVLSLAVAARRGMPPEHVWEHVQKLGGGLDVLAGVTTAEQGSGLGSMWASVGAVLSAQPQADVIADCGRIGTDGPIYDLLAHAAIVVFVTRGGLGDVVRLRGRVNAVSAGLARRGLPGVPVGVLVVTGPKRFRETVSEVGRALADSGRPASVAGGIALEPKSAAQLSGQWGPRLDRSLLIRSARRVATELARCAAQVAPAPQPGQAAPAREPQPAGPAGTSRPARQHEAPRGWQVPRDSGPTQSPGTPPPAAKLAATPQLAAGQDDWPTLLQNPVTQLRPAAGRRAPAAFAGDTDARGEEAAGRAPSPLALPEEG